MADTVRLAYRESGDPEAPPLVLLHGLTSDGTAWDAYVTAPTMVVAGGPESRLPQDEIAAMAARFPAGRLVTIPAGHLVHTTRPGEFCAAVEEFLEALP
ncbi:alpha/beta hydrolase [Streptomyces sp. NPDC002088]|uniref:alpha/beta fold hydrolase n=1 Tax=Streptomyces sp. NPDC002088 TaxID=3154665 RepID=UPI003331D4F1